MTLMGLLDAIRRDYAKSQKANKLTEDLQLIADLDDGTIYGLTGN